MKRIIIGLLVVFLLANISFAESIKSLHAQIESLNTRISSMEASIITLCGVLIDLTKSMDNHAQVINSHSSAIQLLAITSRTTIPQDNSQLEPRVDKQLEKRIDKLEDYRERKAVYDQMGLDPLTKRLLLRD